MKKLLLIFTFLTATSSFAAELHCSGFCYYAEPPFYLISQLNTHGGPNPFYELYDKCKNVSGHKEFIVTSAKLPSHLTGVERINAFIKLSATIKDTCLTY